MQDERLRLGIILGSNREGRFGPIVANWFAACVHNRDDYEVDLIDIAAYGLPDVLSPHRPRSVESLGARLARADAVVIVTPEYNHSFPAALKNAIDWYSSEWQAKPVGFVSYGGIAGGLRAVEHLRQVFAELHAVTIRDTVSFHGAAYQFDSDGQPHAAQACSEAAAKMLNQLAWWGVALREARRRRPYGD